MLKECMKVTCPSSSRQWLMYMETGTDKDLRLRMTLEVRDLSWNSSYSLRQTQAQSHNLFSHSAALKKWTRCQHTISLPLTHTHTHSYNHCAPSVQLRSILTSVEGFLPKQSTHSHRCVMHITYMQRYYAHRGENSLITYPHRPASIYNLFFLLIYVS